MKLNFFEPYKPKPSQIVAERYGIVKQLAANRNSQTFLVRDLHSPGQPDCVISRLDLPIDDAIARLEIAQRFEAEAEALSQVSEHGCIPELLDYFEEDSAFYFVHSPIEGHTLAEEFATSVSWSDQQVVALLNDLLSTLDFVHHRGLLHLDIQPSNLIRKSSDRRIAIAGFSGFWQKSARLIVPFPTVGTPSIFEPSAYMPDEQIAGFPQPSSDIYAVGLVAIEAITGHPLGAIAAHPQTRELYWHSLAARRHLALLALLDYMVQRNFRTRCQSASEALTALSALPPETTWFASAASTSAEQTAAYEAPKSEKFSRRIVPVGLGLAAVAGAGALLWSVAGPLSRIEGGLVAETLTEIQQVEQLPTEKAEVETAGTETAGTETAGTETEKSKSGGAVASSSNAATGDEAGAIARSPEASELTLESAQSTVNQFYDYVASRSWDSARALMSDRLAQQLEPNFFDQFQNVSVEDFRVIEQSSEAVDLVVQNTYVYPDGSYQQEERSYTVQEIDSQPTIVDTSFVEVLKDRSYVE